MEEKKQRSSVHFGKARDYRSQGNLDDAEWEYREGLAVAPAEYEAYFELGQICVEKKEDEKALAEFRKALEYAPENARLHHEIGRIYSRKKEYRLAIEEFEKARAYGAMDGYLSVDLAFACKEIGEYEKTLRELDNIPEGGVPGWQVHFLKGETCALQGNGGRAETELKEALKCDPGNEPAKIQLSILYGHKAEKLNSEGKKEDALREYANAIACRPQESWLRLGLGRLLVVQGKYDQAIREFTAGAKANPADGELRYELGMCYVLKQQYDMAIIELEQAAKLDTGYKAVFELGRIYTQRREYERAREALSDAACRIEMNNKGDLDTVARSYAASVSHGGSYEHVRKQFVNKYINNAETFEGTECFSKPQSLMFCLTYRCNLSCIMCGRVRRESTLLPFEVFEKLKDWIPCAQRINWQGGEVFLVDYFGDLLERTGELYPYIIQNITTNGLLINKEWARLLARLNIQTHFSIDSVVKNTYESIRKGGNFEQLVRNLEMMKDEYAKRYADGEHIFSLHVVVMRRNVNELTLFPEFCKRHGIRFLRFTHMFTRVATDEDVFAVRNDGIIERLKTSIAEVEAKCRELDVQFECFLTPQLHVEGEPLNKPWVTPGNKVVAKKQPFRCARPWNNLFINADGNVMPSCECENGGVPAGNILSDSMGNIWNGNTMKLYRKHIMDNTAERICSKNCLRGLTSIKSQMV